MRQPICDAVENGVVDVFLRNPGPLRDFEGVVGILHDVKVGGRRKLVIPPHLAYGDRSPSPAIKPGETLIFVVDLVDVG